MKLQHYKQYVEPKVESAQKRLLYKALSFKPELDLMGLEPVSIQTIFDATPNIKRIFRDANSLNDFPWGNERDAGYLTFLTRMDDFGVFQEINTRELRNVDEKELDIFLFIPDIIVLGSKNGHAKVTVTGRQLIIRVPLQHNDLLELWQIINVSDSLDNRYVKYGYSSFLTVALTEEHKRILERRNRRRIRKLETPILVLDYQSNKCKKVDPMTLMDQRGDYKRFLVNYDCLSYFYLPDGLDESRIKELGERLCSNEEERKLVMKETRKILRAGFNRKAKFVETFEGMIPDEFSTLIRFTRRLIQTHLEE